MTDLPPQAPGDPAPPTEPYGPTETVETPARRSRRGLVVGAGAAALVAVAGAGLWAATTLSGGGRQPDELVPRSTFAYFKLDLDPAASQKLAARSYFAKFPSLKDEAGTSDDVFEDVLATMLDDPDLDYERDIEPWFDKRAAVAAFPGPGGAPEVVGVLRSKDDEQARTSLDRLVREAKDEGQDVTYRLTRGYAVVGEPDAVAESLRLADDESLRDNAVYRDDVERLDGDQVAVAWANLGEAFGAVKSRIPGAGLLPAALSDQIKGRVVAGLHFTDDYAELQGVSVGFDSRVLPQTTASTSLITTLPADTAAAISVTGLAASVGTAGGLLDLDDLAARYLQGSGLTYSNDIAPLLGDEAVLAAGPFDGLDSLRLGYLARVADPVKAERAGTKAAGLLSFFGIEVDAGVNGDRFVLAAPPDYAAALARGDGTLGTTPKFTKAMGDLTGVGFALYADGESVRGALPALFGQSAGDGGVTSIGATAGLRGRDEAFFRLRVVAG